MLHVFCTASSSEFSYLIFPYHTFPIISIYFLCSFLLANLKVLFWCLSIPGESPSVLIWCLSIPGEALSVLIWCLSIYSWRSSFCANLVLDLGYSGPTVFYGAFSSSVTFFLFIWLLSYQDMFHQLFNENLAIHVRTVCCHFRNCSILTAINQVSRIFQSLSFSYVLKMLSR
jgi:hypothetical protein